MRQTEIVVVSDRWHPINKKLPKRGHTQGPSHRQGTFPNAQTAPEAEENPLLESRVIA